MKTLYCSKCNSEVKENDEKCPNCGVTFLDFHNIDFSQFSFAYKKKSRSVAAERPERFSKDIPQRCAEVSGILVWIRDRFAKFKESPEGTMNYCESIDPEYREQIQNLYVDTLKEAIDLLHYFSEGKTFLSGESRDQHHH